MKDEYNYIERKIQQEISKKLNKGKVLVVYGARRVGKTTLIQNLFTNKKETLYLLCEDADTKEELQPRIAKLKSIIKNYKNIVLDEAQNLDNPGLILKLLIDNFPDRNFVASGSSSFDLANKLNEPLTGRFYEFNLFPLLLSEFKEHFDVVDKKFQIEQSITFGSYPEMIHIQDEEEKKDYLKNLTNSYLYKDILAFNLVRDSKKIRELLLLLALQIGNEVSYSEIGNKLGIDKVTVERYIDLLEKSFVIFRLYGFSRNLRNEINRKVKVYFYDLGVRNSLIGNFSPLEKRVDAGNIFENYVISEIIKADINYKKYYNFHFWRTHTQKEIDLIAEKDGHIKTLEIKMQGRKGNNKHFKFFQQEYSNSSFHLISYDNFIDEIDSFLS